MAHDHPPVAVDPQALKHAETIWHNFAVMVKYAVIGSAIVLLAMGFFLL